jgi:hypothetical protein
MDVESLAVLHCHKAADSTEVRAIAVRVRRTRADLELHFRLDGNVTRICLLPPAVADSIELWRHTCFEAFVAIAGETAYREFNFAPSGEWCAHAFRAYRDRDSGPDQNEFCCPIMHVRATDFRLELDVRIALRSLSEVHSASALRLGLAAVIEPCNGKLSYWALRHPAGKPDFHHPDAFALRLAGARKE